jgi:hypothetical protein
MMKSFYPLVAILVLLGVARAQEKREPVKEPVVLAWSDDKPDAKEAIEAMKKKYDGKQVEVSDALLQIVPDKRMGKYVYVIGHIDTKVSVNGEVVEKERVVHAVSVLFPKGDEDGKTIREWEQSRREFKTGFNEIVLVKVVGQATVTDKGKLILKEAKLLKSRFGWRADYI